MTNHFKILRPVGNPIDITETDIGDNPFSPFHSCLYNSGTAALAAAIMAIHKQRPCLDKPGSSNKPEILIPAYGCPDLISAIVYAGAIPVLVDLEPDSPWMSLEQLRNSITHRTIAIIAVRFFGLPERYEELSILAKQHNLVLIEDSAQGFPVKDPGSYWQGDFIILSFGRGKPVNLLGGGAVLARDSRLIKLLPEPSPVQSTFTNKIKYKLKLFLYNQSMHPFAYGLISRSPGLHVGQTIYKPLTTVNNIPDFTKSLLGANLRAYQNRKFCQKEYSNIFQAYGKEQLIDLPVKLAHNMSQPLLRYPILVKNYPMRDLLYKKLKSYGASLMYKQPLPQIDNVGNLIKQPNTNYPNATCLARQLLTFPTHEAVDNTTLQIIQRAVKEI